MTTQLVSASASNPNFEFTGLYRVVTVSGSVHTEGHWDDIQEAGIPYGATIYKLYRRVEHEWRKATNQRGIREGDSM